MFPTYPSCCYCPSKNTSQRCTLLSSLYTEIRGEEGNGIFGLHQELRRAERPLTSHRAVPEQIAVQAFHSHRPLSTGLGASSQYVMFLSWTPGLWLEVVNFYACERNYRGRERWEPSLCLGLPFSLVVSLLPSQHVQQPRVPESWSHVGNLKPVVWGVHALPSNQGQQEVKDKASVRKSTEILSWIELF